MKKWRYMLFIAILMPISCNEVHYINTNAIKYEASADGDNYLSSVSFSGIDFSFDKDKTDYTIYVPYAKSTIELDYTASDKDATVDVIGGGELYVGNNSIVILVTAKDGSVREYDFTIIRNNDDSSVGNDRQSILDGINSGDSSNITVGVTKDEALNLDSDLAGALKDRGKTLVFKWTDQNGNFVSSLTIDGSKITSTEAIDPNIKRSVSNSKLLNYIEGHTYTAISTVNTNIPEESVYKMTVSGTEDLYYLYYYDNDILNKKPVRCIDGMVEFEVKGGIDYVLLGSSDSPSEAFSGFSWFWPSIIITVLFIVFIVVTKTVMMKVVRNSHKTKIDQDKTE